MKNYSNIIAELNGTHWLMREESLNQMADVIRDIELGTVIDAKATMQENQEDSGVEGMYTFDESTGTAVLDIQGKIMPRANLMTMMSGGVSTEMLTKAVKHLDEREDVKRVVMNFDSPGGAGVGLTNLSNAIRNMRTDTISFAQGGMYSAAYYFGSAADKLYVSPNGGVGSIGVYTMLASRAKQNEMMGVDVRIIRSTPMKGKGHAAEPIDEDTVKKYQKQVDQLHAEFVRVVAQNRGLSEEFVLQNMADASVVMGSDAEGTGFVDGVLTRDEVFASFTETNSNTINTGNMDFSEQELAELSEAYDADVESTSDIVRLAKAQAGQLEDLRSEHKALQTAFDSMKEQKEQNEIEALLDEAIERDQKFAPAKRADLRELAEEDGIDTLRRTVALVDAGSAAPKQMKETVEAPQASEDEMIKAARADGKKVALDEDEAAFYEEAGSDYIRKEDLADYYG